MIQQHQRALQERGEKNTGTKYSMQPSQSEHYNKGENIEDEHNTIKKAKSSSLLKIFILHEQNKRTTF
jgi:hypothetical protein